jgi:ribosomal protein L15
VENRALAQALRSGTGPKGADGHDGETSREGKNWLPDALERFLKR